MPLVEYTIDGRKHAFEVEGESDYGDDVILIDHDDNLLENVPWQDKGFTVEPFLSPESFQYVKMTIREIVIEKLAEFGVDVPEDFKLEQYHRYTEQRPDLHPRIIAITRKCFPLERFPFDKREIVDRISEICRMPLTLKGHIIPEVFCLRLCRPERESLQDNNPPHKDVWMERLRHGINIYAPIAGSNENSSLSIMPGSHRWKESEIRRTRRKAVVNGIVYSIPSVTDTAYGMHMIRPRVRENEVLVFSPYTIHGGAANLNRDATRVSLEMRFFRK